MEGRVSRILIISLLLTASVALCSADQMSGPVSGLLVDRQTHSIRPIVGLAGSAYAGGNAVGEAEFALAASDGRTALVVKRATLFSVGNLDSGQPVWRKLGENKAAAGAAAWSADAKSLAVYFPSASRLRMWTGAQETPESTGDIDLSLIEGRVSALAVGSDGRTAFATIENGEAGALYMLRVGESPRMLQAMSRGSLLAVSGASIYAADRERNEVVRIEGWDSNLTMTTVATSAHGVSDPVGIALTADGRRLLVANGKARQVLVLDAGTSTTVGVVDLDFTPTSLEASGRVFLLAEGEAGQRPAQVLEPAGMTVHFVPIPAPAAAPVVE